MTWNSLRVRLLLAAAVSLTAALLVAGLVLVKLFERHVDKRIERELATHLQQIAALLEADASGGIVVSGRLADPRYELPFSGLYWQVFENGKPIASSPSVADEVLPISAVNAQSDEVACIDVRGPQGRPMVLVARALAVKFGEDDHRLMLAAAVDQSEVEIATREFGRDLAVSLAILGASLMVAAWMQVFVGLSPLATLRGRLQAVRGGQSMRLGGSHPEEVQGLVDDLDGLLDHQEQSLARARARAGDLAHGLKTPLMALQSVAHDVEAKGDRASALDIRELAQRMQGHVTRELARSHILGRRTEPDKERLLDVVLPLVDTLRRLPRGGDIEWSIEIDDDRRLALDRGDLQELVGNLLDNALRFAQTRVRVAAPAAHVLTVEDDGPGIVETEFAAVLKRGASSRSAPDNAGLGLAIVSEIADLYELRIRLFRSPLGGLGVAIEPRGSTAST